MTSRVLAVLAVASLVCALPVAAQRAGTIEVGGFARYVDFDNTLPMGDDMDIGGRVGVYLEPALTLEVDRARSSQSSAAWTAWCASSVGSSRCWATASTSVAT